MIVSLELALGFVLKVWGVSEKPEKLGEEALNMVFRQKMALCTST